MAQIKNIQDLIGPILRDRELMGMETSNLTEAGDNYGSSMLKVDIKVKKGNEVETILAVAKMLPQNEFIRQAFNSQFTFRNEVGYYQKIAPLLRQFQEEQGVTDLYQSFPALYGARLSLDPQSSKLDDDAVLLIKNIKSEGFNNVQRTIGFNLHQSKLILEKMAELHATFMAFKAHKPDVFSKELSQFFREFKIFDFGDDDNSTRVKVLDTLIEIIKGDEFCDKNMDKVKNVLDSVISKKYVKNKEESPDDLFLSFVHSDMWINNIMIKEVDGKVTDVKFVDYQIYEYSYLTRDVIFFLLSSVEMEVVKDHLDYLLNLYYENLISWLKKLNFDISRYSFEAFIESIKKQLLEMEFFHVMIMLGPIYAEAENIRKVEEMSEEAVIEQRKQVSQQCKEKGCFIVKELITRGWL